MEEIAEKVKIQNIIDMAFTFSSMTRVFEKGSDKKIETEIMNRLSEFFSVNNKKEYGRKHDEFCEWFTAKIKISKEKKKGRSFEKIAYASWGQAAKVLDVVLGVCIYYCNLPSAKISCKIIPWLNAAVDNAMMRDLKKRYNAPLLSGVYSIADVDHAKYMAIQRLLRIDIRKSFNGKILPIQWDDIMWRRLNK